MKYIITESRLESAVIHYLNEMYGDLKEYRTDEYPNMVFYVKDKKVYMELSRENGDLWIDYSSIWEDLETIFGLEDEEIERIITKWAKKTYNISRKVPLSYFHRTLIPTGDTFEVYV